MAKKKKVQYKRGKKLGDCIYNIMIYQVFLVSILFIGIYINNFFGAFDTQWLKDYMEEIIPTEGSKQDVSVYNYDYISPILDIMSGEGGMGGFNPFMQIGSESKVQVPVKSSLAPIILSQSPAVPLSGKVTSTYGMRNNPITDTPDFHRGIDIAAKEGSAIYSALPAIVSNVGEDMIYGNYILLDHGNGLSSYYAHCDEIIAKTGAVIRKGERIATVGSTGYSTGPHLHFEILHNDISYNPAWIYSF